MADQKKPHEMTFVEFAEAVRPSGAVNRFPKIGPGADVYSYSVYMNGPLVSMLPADAREHLFKDVSVHALTEKLGLSWLNPRDNMRVAELAATRHSWMAAVLEASLTREELAPEVSEDYTQLTNGMTHPWISSELKTQMELSKHLKPALALAGIGRDVIPQETSVGRVVAQDPHFTMQTNGDGEIVTHENRRLKDLPAVGDDVAVTYYRGNGQVFNVHEKVKVSAPFVDPQTKDLAVMLETDGAAPSVVLFNSVGGYAKFVHAHGLKESLIETAMDARQASPKLVTPIPPRELITPPYLDKKSGCLAFDYREHGSTYTALFGSAMAMSTRARDFGLSARAIATAQTLEAQQQRAGQAGLNVEASETRLRADLKAKGIENFVDTGISGRQYVGRIIAVSPLHVAQDTGRGVVAIHDVRTLDKAPALNDRLTVKFEGGRGQVTDMVKDGKDLGR